MILHFFTWQQFLIAAVIFTVAWYAGFLLLIAKNRTKKNKVERLQKEWEDELDEDDLIGANRLPEGISEVEAHTLDFAPKIWDETEEETRETQLGVIPDLLQDLKTIFNILEKESGTKDDFFSLFAPVKARYIIMSGSAQEAALNEFIRENALFPISDEELINLWN